MALFCPNCGVQLAATTPATTAPLQCSGCEKTVYFPQQGHFPAVVPLTFASAASPGVPLMPFFHAEVVAEANTQVDSGGEITGETAPLEDSAQSFFVQPGGEELPTIGDAPFDVGAPNDMQPNDMRLLSLAGGSVAAAITPAPSAGTHAAIDDSGALATPWDNAQPPHTDEQWTAGAGALPPAPLAGVSGPPPLQDGPPKLKLPPPVPKKDSVEEIARQLGLPAIAQRQPQALPPALVVSAPIALEDEPPKSNKGLTIIGLSVLLVSAAVAFFFLSRATKELEKPIAPAAQASIAASIPVNAPEINKPDVPKADPAKRAAAIEFYSKGNKLYMAKKFKGAESEYKKALEADESFALAFRGLGVTYASQEKNQKAIDAYKSYLKLAPDAKDAKLVRQIIKEAEQQK